MVLSGIAASVGGYKPENMVEEVAKPEITQPPIDSKEIEFNDWDNPKLVLSYFAATYGWNKRIAYAIMMAESGGDPTAQNLRDNHKGCSGSFGLFQLACFRGSKEDLLTVPKNIELAYKLWLKEGWNPWSTYHNGKYLEFY